MPKKNDRVVIKFGPGRLDSDKSIQREIDSLKNDIETRQTNVDLSDYPTTGEVEDIVNDILNGLPTIPGGGGYIIGLPPGSQFAYIPMDLVEYPIPLDNVKRFSAGMGLSSTNEPNGKLSVDVNNVLGHGTNTVLAYDTTTDTLIGYSVEDGLVELVTFTMISTGGGGFGSVTSPTSFMSLNGKLVSKSEILLNYVIGGSTIPGVYFYTYDGAAKGNFFVPRPALAGSSGAVLCTGPSADNNTFFVVWYAPSTTTMIVEEYSPSGTLLSSAVKTIGHTFSANTFGKIENGWITFPSRGGSTASWEDNVFVVLPATVVATDIAYFSAPGCWSSPLSNVTEFGASYCRSITPSGVMFVVADFDGGGIPAGSDSRVDLLVCDYSTNSATLIPGAVVNTLDPTERPFFTDTIANSLTASFGGVPCSGVLALDDNNVLICSATISSDGTYYYHTPSTMVLNLTEDPTNPGGILVSATYTVLDDLIGNASSTTVVRPNNAVRDPTPLPNGTVCYYTGLNANGIGIPPSYLFNVEFDL